MKKQLIKVEPVRPVTKIKVVQSPHWRFRGGARGAFPLGPIYFVSMQCSAKILRHSCRRRSISFSTDVILVEDVLSSRVAHYWAPDGAHFCYATFDDTETPSIRYPFYGDKTQVYPDTVEIRYPKVQYPSYLYTLRY